VLSLGVEFVGLSLEHPVLNASGPRCTTLNELQSLADSRVSAVVSKSCTLDSRSGNEEPRYADFSGGSINSSGLPNPGLQGFRELFPKLNLGGKPLIASVSGLTLAENLEITKAFCQLGQVEAIELNLSCPNVEGKPQTGYDFDISHKVLQEVGEVCTKPLGVKLPPYFDFSHFESMAEILNQSMAVFITCINSLGNGLVIDPQAESALIRPKCGFGGVGGPAIKPFGLSNVHKFRELLSPGIQIMGVGGIRSGLDVFEYILAGADAVQVGTAYQQEGVSVFSRIVKELTEVMQKKGYESLGDFRGKLKLP
jgi:dihydroorotate dehydrogenase (fumarate)